jgi:hypothetical protein
MNVHRLKTLVIAIGAATLAPWAATVTAESTAIGFWQTVVNNGDSMPTDKCDNGVPVGDGKCRNFNSYNQPSVNVDRLVVIRARSKGGGGSHGGGGETAAVSPAAEDGGSGGTEHGNQPIHGIYTRDMAAETPIVKILDRKTEVPQPNNIRIPPETSPNPGPLTTFIETPSMPRIDMWSDTIATRGNHQPVWKVVNDAGEIIEQLGTTGIYTNPFGPLVTGSSKLGVVPDFAFFQVPEAPGTPFDVFPGAPAVTDGATIVFKGNYTVDDPNSGDPADTVGKTGVYYRDLTSDPIPLADGTELAPAGGTNPVVLIANNTTTKIPGTNEVFGSTAPPSAATLDGKRMAVFAGFDNEESPTLGGIYLAPLAPYLPGAQPKLQTLVAIGGEVPGEKKGIVFNRLGEGVSFDGRFVAFWGAWGTKTKQLTLQCRDDGNPDRVEFCKGQHPDGYTTTVPVNQGFFVHDTKTGKTEVVAKAPGQYSDFVYWNFSGLVPGTGESDEDGEPARWRSASFVAVSGVVDGSLTDATSHTAFKARTGSVENGAYVNPVDGIYLRKSPGASPILTVVKTGMDGTLIDPEAVYLDEATGESMNLPVTEMGIERDGFRGNSLAVNVSMGTEEAGWAGVYLTEVYLTEVPE